jgi:ABC transporter
MDSFLHIAPGKPHMFAFIGNPEVTEALRPSAALEPQPIAIATEHLSRTVVDRVLVSDITVQVQLGEVLAVVGPSGAGKSSFLRLLNRLPGSTSHATRAARHCRRVVSPRRCHSPPTAAATRPQCCPQRKIPPPLRAAKRQHLDHPYT